MNNKPLTMDDLRNLAEKLEPKPKTVFVNQRVFDEIKIQLGYMPSNVVLCNHVPSNQAIIMNINPKERSY